MIAPKSRPWSTPPTFAAVIDLAGAKVPLDYLDGLIAACPATRSCREPRACQLAPSASEIGPEPVPVCSFTDTGEPACGAPGLVFECPPGTTAHLRKCPCRLTPVPAPCTNLELTLVCR